MSNNKITQVTAEDIHGNKYQVATSDLTFRPAVYGVVIQDGKVLLSKQWGGYDFPGGGIDIGEGTKVACIRELKEETGLDVTIGSILHCNNSFFKLPYRDNFVHSIHMYYECKIVGGELSTEFFDENEKEYADMAEWVDLSTVGDIKMYSSVGIEEVLADYL